MNNLSLPVIDARNWDSQKVQFCKDVFECGIAPIDGTYIKVGKYYHVKLNANLIEPIDTKDVMRDSCMPFTDYRCSEKGFAKMMSKYILTEVKF